MKKRNQAFQSSLRTGSIYALTLTCALLLGCSSEVQTPKLDSLHNGHSTGAVSPDQNGRAGDGAVFFNNPRAVGEEPDGNIIVADFSSGHIVRINRQTGDRQLLSDNNNSDQGPAFSQAAGVAILPNGRIFVSDLVFNNVYEIDTVTGARTVVSDESEFQIRQPFGITEGIVNGKRMIVIADTGSPEDGGVVGPVLMDPDTGKVIAIPVPEDNDVFYNDPRSVDVVAHPDAENGESDIIMGNFGQGTIVRVNPTTGKRTIISQSHGDQIIGDGPPFVSITDISISRDKKDILVLDLAQEAVFAVNLVTGKRVAVSRSYGEQSGSGFNMLNPHGIQVVDDGYMITDFGAPGVIFIDLDGKRTEFSVTPVKGFGQIRGIEYLSDGNYAAADFGGEALYIVDGKTGERTLLSGRGKGTGPNLNGPVSVLELDADTLALSEFSSQSVLYVDRKTGNRKFLTTSTQAGHGDGPPLGTRSLEKDPLDASRLFAGDFNLDAIFEVDLETGNRRIYSSAITDTPRGDGPPLNNPFGIDVSPEGLVYVADIGLQAVVEIDRNGNRRIISSNDGRGEGIELGSPWGIQLLGGEIYVGDGEGVIHVDRETGNRTLVSPGGPIFTMRELETGQVAIANIGIINGIEIGDLTGNRTILSNEINP